MWYVGGLWVAGFVAVCAVCVSVSGCWVVAVCAEWVCGWFFGRGVWKRCELWDVLGFVAVIGV